MIEFQRCRDTKGQRDEDFLARHEMRAREAIRKRSCGTKLYLMLQYHCQIEILRFMFAITCQDAIVDVVILPSPLYIYLFYTLAQGKIFLLRIR